MNGSYFIICYNLFILYLFTVRGFIHIVFNGYNKGLTYEGAAGLMMTTKNHSRYYLQGIYHYQEINDFFLQSGRPTIKSFGAGIGTWF